MATFCASNQKAMNYINAQSGDSSDLQTLISNIKNGRDIVAAGTKANRSLYNNLITILNRIYSYGNYGTRNPTGIPGAVGADAQFLYTQYNNLINCLQSGSGNLTSGTYLTAAQMNAIGTKIKNYNFNSNRCNSCNTAQYSQYGQHQDSCYAWGGG